MSRPATIADPRLVGAPIGTTRGRISSAMQYFDAHTMTAVTASELRDRSGATSPGLRKPEMIAMEEIAEGAVEVVTFNLGAAEEEIITRVARMLGFKATSAQLRTAIIEAVAHLTAGGTLKPQDGILVANEA